MRFYLSILFLLILIASLTACSHLGDQSSEQPPQINQAHVERIITTLSADDMQGRRTFTPGIEKASRFIESEFEKIGLEHLDGLDGYAQRFEVYALTPRQLSVMLNGQTVPEERCLVSTSHASVGWTTETDIEVITIGPDDNLQGRFNALRRSPTDALVLVDESHQGFFNRIHQFLSGPTRTMNLSEGGTALFVLTSETDVQSYDIRIENDIETLGLNNVVGQITGRRTDEVVLFSAHYDHIGIRPAVEGDSIANGANDDASGTTAVIALADYFNKMEQPERTLIFVAFTAEEMGGYGSQYFSRQLDPDQIVAMFNIEMIGKPAVEGPNTAWITGFERSSFGTILQEAVEGTPYTFYPDPYPNQNLFFRSDNATLARLGVPAHSISTTPIDVDQDYHQVSDEVETLDLEHMTNTIKAIAQAAVTIINGESTPTRVDVDF